MFFERVYENGLAHASYVIGCQATGQALVLDPQRDVDVYLEIAAREQLTITHVAESHIHADFLSGARELAAATGAEMYLSDEGGPDWQYTFDHVGIRDGDHFMVGNLRLDVMHTPGHTPEHISLLLTDTPAGDAPMMLFSGDFVFVGDVGRPDLLEEVAGAAGSKAEGAKQMWDSLRRFGALPPFLQVWPGHGAGSACGKALGAVPSSTVGYEMATSWAFRHGDEAAFAGELLEGQPEPPVYFAEMKHRNRNPRRVLSKLPEPPVLTPDQLDAWISKGATLIDARNKVEFAQGHIPGSLNIQNNRAFSTWAGWLVAYDTPIVLVAPADQVETIVRALVRIGLDDVVGFLPDVAPWAGGARTLQTIEQLSPTALAERLTQNRAVVVDVRAAAEFGRARIPSARNVHLGYLAARMDELPRDRTLVLHCQSGDRSSAACSVLARAGVRDIANLEGGIEAWRAAGLEIIEPVGVAP